jgi:dihydropteroate synthase
MPVVMGIVNCTPDSFFDGGRLADASAAIALAGHLVDEGATIIDVGGESTRPGADPVPTEIERDRVVPVIAALRRRRPDLLLSVDTSKAEVAREALRAGADLVNDVSGGSDDRLLATVAEHGAGIVLMHMRGTPRTMQTDTTYRNVVAEVHHHLAERAETARAAGIEPELTWLDPGIGFGKDTEGNLRLLAALTDLAALGHPVVVGASRKSFIGDLSGADADQRLPGSLAALGPVVGLDRAVVRVHDVAATVQYLSVASRLREVGA